MGILWVGTALVFGWLAQRARQPPVLGFLAAGFALEAWGAEAPGALTDVADLGVRLLLFGIGLKLDLRNLAKPYVFGFAVGHMGLVGLAYAALLSALSALGIGAFAGTSGSVVAALAFALSFSSTILALRILEERNDLGAVYGQVALGILVVQDLAAVVFLALMKGQLPSPWALALLVLVPARPLLHRFLARAGHGEVLLLTGLGATLGAAALFEAVGLKGDLGALVAGVLLAGTRKSNEMAKALLSLKNLLLVGFFVSVGLAGSPTWGAVQIALGLLALLPVKLALFFGLGVAFRLRARTAFWVATSMSQISEFGLIVLLALVRDGRLTSDWLIGFALALSASFVLSMPLSAATGGLYLRFNDWLRRFERPRRIAPEQPVDAAGAKVLVFGMGRLGTAAFDRLVERGVPGVLGIDLDPNVVAEQAAKGRRVVLGSATDADLWERLHVDKGAVEWILLATASAADHASALDLLRREGVSGRRVVTARYADELEALHAAGADVALHVFDEAGAGLADHVLEASPEQNAA